MPCGRARRSGRSRPCGGENSAAIYKYDRRAALATDRIAVARAAYEREGPGRTNRRYGYVTRPTA